MSYTPVEHEETSEEVQELKPEPSSQDLDQTYPITDEEWKAKVYRKYVC